MSQKKILGICGSLRAESYNLKLLRNFLSLLEQGGAETRLYPPLEMPLMNEDLENKPLAQPILDFRKALEEYPIIVVASPEYNASTPANLKNAIDWGSRPPKNLWDGKVGVLLSASPGALGGARNLIHLRTVLSGIKTWLVPEQVQCSLAHTAFAADGQLTNEMVKKQMVGAATALNHLADKLL